MVGQASAGHRVYASSVREAYVGPAAARQQLGWQYCPRVLVLEKVFMYHE